MDTIANTTVPAGSTEQWRDPKRYLWLIGLVVPSLFFLGYAGWLATGWPGLFWIGPVVILVIVPAIDLFAGLDRSNPPDDVIEALEKDRYYRWITYLFLPIQYVGFVAAMYLIARGDPLGVRRRAPAVGQGRPRGLDRLHRRHRHQHRPRARPQEGEQRALAVQDRPGAELLRPLLHRAQPRPPRPRRDPGGPGQQPGGRELLPVLAAHGRSARCKSAWRIEKRRYARKKQHPFRIGNDVLNAWLMSLVLWGALVAWLGVEIVPYLVIQAVVGFSLLEVVNYMEHYGMLRQKVGVGERQRYERVDPSHSWNSNNIATNVLLYHLQRHSDHHANPTRRYQTLRDYEESPVLPTGYAGMIVLAIVPAVWRRVMDPRVLHHFDGDLSRANLSPRKRDKILAAYPPPVARRAGVDRRADRRAGRAGRGAGRAVPGLWLHLRGRGRRRARGLRGRDGVGRHPGQLVLPRLRRPGQGRLHPAGPGAGPLSRTYRSCP